MGYSFEFNGIERIGAWDRRGRFDTAWVQGTPQVPTNSNRLTWNDEGLIVVSFTTDGRVYVIPRPGQRLDLASLVQGSTLPTGDPSVIDLNDRGDILLSSPATFETFLLERVGCEGRGERAHRGPREQSDDD